VAIGSPKDFDVIAQTSEGHLIGHCSEHRFHGSGRPRKFRGKCALNGEESACDLDSGKNISLALYQGVKIWKTFCRQPNSCNPRYVLIARAEPGGIVDHHRAEKPLDCKELDSQKANSHERDICPAIHSAPVGQTVHPARGGERRCGAHSDSQEPNIERRTNAGHVDCLVMTSPKAPAPAPQTPQKQYFA
jgi:hypothetical protein